jgi:hypothetical protein
MARRRWWCLLNPPDAGAFQEHERGIQERAAAHELGPVTVRYGLGSCAELELESQNDAAVVAFLEVLRRDLKITSLDPVCTLTAAERDGIEADVQPAVSYPS